MTVGLAEGTWPYYLDKLKHLILPGVTQALLGTAVTIQYLRSEVIDVKTWTLFVLLVQKECQRIKFLIDTFLEMQRLPIASQLGYEITALIAGSVVIEKIFAFPGIGKLFIDSIIQRDYSVITALVLILGLATLIGTLISDIVMSIVDPRIRIQ